MVLGRLTRLNGGFADRELAGRALVLGLVTLSASLAMNLYVPAFPKVAADLGVDGRTIQLSVSSYLAALAIGQNIYGPLSDRHGRRVPLCVGLAIYALASIGTATSASAEALMLWRFMQGLGACAAMVIPRAVVRDLYTGVEAARMLAMVMVVVSVAPLMAPMLGSALTAVLPWNALFWFMAAAASGSLLLVIARLPESCPIGRRAPGGIGAMAGRYRVLLTDRRFVAQVALLAFAQSGFFVFLAGSPQVFLQIHGLATWQYSLVFAVTAIAWVGTAQFAPALIERLGAERLATIALAIGSGVMVLLLALAAIGAAALPLIVLAVMILFGAVGLTIPTVTVVALHEHGAAAGTATALIGTLNFAMGAVMSGVLGALPGGTELPMIGLMAACTVAALATTPIALSRSRSEG
jgi:DHA1 family bicyclomycin/chloramphenicol resistance-like MFS transporter